MLGMATADGQCQFPPVKPEAWFRQCCLYYNLPYVTPESARTRLLSVTHLKSLSLFFSSSSLLSSSLLWLADANSLPPNLYSCLNIILPLRCQRFLDNLVQIYCLVVWASLLSPDAPWSCFDSLKVFIFYCKMATKNHEVAVAKWVNEWIK